ncbi:hypothetical protein [Dongia deserti]|uniref:hypothetical protein n=1 Tax=Dongia deserti TaxID=2268030 RepID=UPI0013C447F6|nr:hypothetical protein [Dongia deserti]
MPETLDELRRRFEKHLRHVDETTLVVLKAHLLIEEMLDSIISSFVFHPKFIEAANLRFAQKISVARSMSLDEHENEMWEIAVKLNSLRNELAHALDSPKRTAKTQAVIDLYFRLSADARNPLQGQPEHIVLSYAAAFFLGFLSSFYEEVKRFRHYVDALDEVMNRHRHAPEGGPA